MLTREGALRILEEENTPPDVVEHCEAVARKAVATAKKALAAGHEVDVQLVETGALLHDLGRAQTHGVGHGFMGGVILRNRGLVEHARIAEKHVGAGISKQEAKRLGLAPRDYIPRTLEEKIIANADNLVDGIHPVTIWETVQKMRGHGDPEEAVERVLELYKEIESLTASS